MKNIETLIEKYIKPEGDTITMDIPLLIRLFEYAREDAKTDFDLHVLAKNMVGVGKRTLTIFDYKNIIP